MSDTEFVHVRHPDIEVGAVVARTALQFMTGWVVVDEPTAVAASATKRTRKRAPRPPAPPVVDEPTDPPPLVEPAEPVAVDPA